MEFLCVCNICFCVRVSSAVFRVDILCSGKVDEEAFLTMQLNLTIHANNYTVLNFKRRKMCYKSKNLFMYTNVRFKNSLSSENLMWKAPYENKLDHKWVQSFEPSHVLRGLVTRKILIVWKDIFSFINYEAQNTVRAL